MDTPEESNSSKVVHVFTVRARPVGLEVDRWGGGLIAIERGHFPISSTGYRSLCSHAQGRPVTADSVPAEFLESLAKDQDRDRNALLQRLRAGFRPQADRLMVGPL